MIWLFVQGTDIGPAAHQGLGIPHYPDSGRRDRDAGQSFCAAQRTRRKGGEKKTQDHFPGASTGSIIC